MTDTEKAGDSIRGLLQKGLVIPAHPLALNAARKLDERRQRALSRYYAAAGAGGLAVGVHTTQFAIRNSEFGLFRPVLELAAEEMDRADSGRAEPLARIGGVCGKTAQAVTEAALLRSLGYHAALLSLAALRDQPEEHLLEHCRAVAEIVPLVGFYLQPAVGGRMLSCRFWRSFAEIESVVAIKIAPFDRYRTLDVIRSVAESGRTDVALYTGNDDNLVLDLLTPYQFRVYGQNVRQSIVGGLLGHWAVWTSKAVELHAACRTIIHSGAAVPQALLQRSVEVTDSNSAFFDAANGFAGCIAGLHAVLCRQGLLEGIWLLDPDETLSPGQQEEIDRVHAAYGHLHDDAFVAAGREVWLSG